MDVVVTYIYSYICVCMYISVCTHGTSCYYMCIYTGSSNTAICVYVLVQVAGPPAHVLLAEVPDLPIFKYIYICIDR
jgi:hypothetical protein